MCRCINDELHFNERLIKVIYGKDFNFFSEINTVFFNRKNIIALFMFEAFHKSEMF